MQYIFKYTSINWIVLLSTITLTCITNKSQHNINPFCSVFVLDKDTLFLHNKNA